MVSGDPEPSIAWYHNGNKLGAENAVLIHPYNCLSISSVEMKHSGVYRLFARNSGGTAMSEFTMRVRPTEQEKEEMVNDLTMRNKILQ